MAPSTPPPPSKVVLAAFTIASTASLVMSPRVRASLESGIGVRLRRRQFRFVNQPDAAGIFVKRPRQIHRARLAVQRKRFHVRMCFPPLGKSPPDAAFVRDIELRGEAADIVKNKKPAWCERRIPKIEFCQSGLIFVRAIKND